MFKGRKSRTASSSEAQQGFNSSDVARICGVSLRQLQWWDERNVVSPRQDGHKRIYMPEEVVEISDRILVLGRGRSLGTLEGERCSVRDILELAFGVERQAGAA